MFTKVFKRNLSQLKPISSLPQTSITLDHHKWIAAVKSNGRDYLGLDVSNPYIAIYDVTLKNCGNIQPYKGYPTFPHADSVRLVQCDKNFVYYYMGRHVFPRARMFHLDSHPCDPDVLNRFNKKTTIVLAKRFAEYKQRWASNNSTVIVSTEF